MPDIQEREQEVAFVSKPVPDPTERTTQQLIREVAIAREIVETKIEGIKTTFIERFNGNDKAIELVKSATTKELQNGLDALEKVINEQLRGIRTQISERDTRAEQTKKDNEVSLGAALSAAEKAVGKTELGFTKEFDSMKANNMATLDGFRGQFEDLKTRIGTAENRLISVESNKIGATEYKGTTNTATSQLVSIIAVIAAIAAIVVSIVMHFAR